MSETIFAAQSPADYNAFGELVGDYVEWCRKRFSDYPWFVDMVFSHQSLEQELSALESSYAPPKGKILLAASDGQIRGGVAYRTIAAGVCEMKRLFVPDRFKGIGTGKRLCEELVAHARADGFAMMRLDTAILLHEAIKLYRSIGFFECDPYNDYPNELRPFILFMEMSLIMGACRQYPD